MTPFMIRGGFSIAFDEVRCGNLRIVLGGSYISDTGGVCEGMDSIVLFVLMRGWRDNQYL